MAFVALGISLRGERREEMVEGKRITDAYKTVGKRRGLKPLQFHYYLSYGSRIDAAFWRPRRVARQFGAKRRIVIGGIYFRR